MIKKAIRKTQVFWLAMAMILGKCPWVLSQETMEKVIPLLDDNTFAIMRVLPGKIDIQKVIMPMVQKKAIPVAQAFAIVVLVNGKKAGFDKNVEEVWLASSSADLSSGFTPRMVFKPRPGVTQEGFVQAFKEGLLPLKVKSAEGMMLYDGKNPWVNQEFELIPKGDLFVLQVAGSSKGDAIAFRPEWKKSWRTISEAPVQLILVPNKHARQVVDLFRGNNARPLEQESFKATNIGFFVDPWKIEATFYSENAIKAKEAYQQILSMIRIIPDYLGKELNEVAKDPIFQMVNKMVQSTKLEDDHVKIVIDDFEPVFQMVSTLNAKDQEQSNFTLSQNRMRQVGMALLAYAHENGSLPPAFSRGPDGKPLLSWRVHILPYLGNRLLYRQFRLNEPWDSEHNIKLVRRMPAIFREPSMQQDRGETAILGVVGNQAAIVVNGKGRSLDTVTAPRIMLLQGSADKSVVWTKPEDRILDETKLDHYMTNFPEKTVALFSDGSTKVVATKELMKMVGEYLIIDK
jgi:hypothetical protein